MNQVCCCLSNLCQLCPIFCRLVNWKALVSCCFYIYFKFYFFRTTLMECPRSSRSPKKPPTEPDWKYPRRMQTSKLRCSRSVRPLQQLVNPVRICMFIFVYQVSRWSLRNQFISQFLNKFTLFYGKTFPGLFVGPAIGYNLLHWLQKIPFVQAEKNGLIYVHVLKKKHKTFYLGKSLVIILAMLKCLQANIKFFYEFFSLWFSWCRSLSLKYKSYPRH